MLDGKPLQITPTQAIYDDGQQFMVWSVAVRRADNIANGRPLFSEEQDILSMPTRNGFPDRLTYSQVLHYIYTVLTPLAQKELVKRAQVNTLEYADFHTPKGHIRNDLNALHQLLFRKMTKMQWNTLQYVLRLRRKGQQGTALHIMLGGRSNMPMKWTHLIRLYEKAHRSFIKARQQDT